MKEEYETKWYQTFLQKCPSKTACKQTNYLIRESLMFKTETRVKDIFKDYTKTPSSEVTIQYANPMVEYHQEVITYDFQSVIGEIGGTLGMTIGLSFLCIGEWFINFVKYLMEQRHAFLLKTMEN